MIDSSYAGWSELCCYEIGTRIVAHLTAKSLVGYPLCRDPELIELFAAYGNAVPVSGFFISMFPEIMKPYISPQSWKGATQQRRWLRTNLVSRFVARLCQAPKMASRLDQMFLDEMERRDANPPKEPGVCYQGLPYHMVTSGSTDCITGHHGLDMAVYAEE